MLAQVDYFSHVVMKLLPASTELKAAKALGLAR
jgi:hypothetical protein